MIAALLLTAMIAASPAAAPAGPSALGAPISKDGVEITVLQQVSPGGANAVTQIGLDIEAKTADAAARLGFHSLHAVADIDCARSSNRFVSAEAFDQPGWAGASRPRNITGQWVEPASDSYMAAVIGRVCTGPTKVAAQTRPPVVRQMTATPAPSPSPQPLAPAAALQTAAAPAPTPSPPQVVKFSGAGPSERPIIAAPTPAAAAPAPAAAAPPPAAAAAAPPPSGPLVVKFSASAAGDAPRSSADAAAPSGPASYIPKKAGERVAQVAASADQRDAESVLRQLRPLIEPPLTTTIEQAVVGAAHVYRADVIGFQTAADAKAFCKAAAHISKTCWVRARSDGPTSEATPLRGPKTVPTPKRAG